jgi:spore maturation protein SpmB
MASKTYFEMFVEGARDGWRIGIHSLLPNIVMAFILIKILEDTGVMRVLGRVCAPVMALFGVPGEAMTALVAGLLSISGGVGAAASLLASGALSGQDVTIILPGIFLLGGQLENLGRILGVIGIAPRFYPMLWAVTLLNAVIGMLLMRVFLSVM